MFLLINNNTQINLKILFYLKIFAIYYKKCQIPREILNDDNQRYVLFPLKYNNIFNLRKKALASFWTVEEVDLSKDANDWNKLNENEQHFIKNILAFFAGSDGIVLENLGVRFMQDVKIPYFNVLLWFPNSNGKYSL